MHRVEELRVRDAVAARAHGRVIRVERAVEPGDELEAPHRARARRRRRRGVDAASRRRRRHGAASSAADALGAAAMSRARGFCARCGAALRLTTRARDVACGACGRAHTLEEGARTARRARAGGGADARREADARRAEGARTTTRGLTTTTTTRAAFGDRTRELTAGAKEFKFHHGVEARQPNGTKVGAAEEVTRERATVDEKCPKCKHKGLNFYTMQLRSADEGQTVFYECPKCAHTFSQNN